MQVHTYTNTTDMNDIERLIEGHTQYRYEYNIRPFVCSTNTIEILVKLMKSIRILIGHQVIYSSRIGTVNVLFCMYIHEIEHTLEQQFTEHLKSKIIG